MSTSLKFKTIASFTTETVRQAELRCLKQRLFSSGGHFMKYWGGECQGPRKIYMSVP